MEGKMATRKTNKRGARNKFSCGSCEEEVKEDDLAVACEVCERWFHITCEEIPEPVNEFMVDDAGGEQLKWHCSQCKKGCANLYQYIKKVHK